MIHISGGMPIWFQIAMLILQLACMAMFVFWFLWKAFLVWWYSRTIGVSLHIKVGIALTGVALTAYMGFVFGQLCTVSHTDMSQVLSLWPPVCIFYLASKSVVRLWQFWLNL